MKYAAKVQLPAPHMRPQTAAHFRTAGVSKFSDVPQIVSMTPDRELVAEVKALLPRRLCDAMLGVHYLRVRTGYPHIHVNVGDTVLNWYISTSGEEVTFYDGEVRDITATHMLDVGNGYVLADPALLTRAESFVPQHGDVWLLNAAAPHSITFHAEEEDYFKRYQGDIAGDRLMLHATFDIPFQEARQLLSLTT